MSFINKLIIANLFILYVGVGTTATFSDTTLELVFVIFRHGERVPETNEQFPNDPIKIDHFHPFTYGDITKEGMRRQHRFGTKLRKKYDDFLGPIYAKDLAIAYSTDWDRTKVGALLTLAGLFPPHPSQQWSADLKWMPIPYHYIPTDGDYLIRRPDPYCPRYANELKKVFASEIVANITKKYQHVFDYVTQMSGRNMFNYHEMFRIFQNIHAKKFLNLTIPEWASRVYPEPLQTIASFQCVFENFTPLLKRLNGGHILQKFIEMSRMKISGALQPPGRKMFLYSGHENNIVNILSVLGVYERHVPPYCSGVMVELHRRPSPTPEYGFKVFYDNDTYTEGSHALQIPGCSAFCSFDELVNLTTPFVPVNYTAECESDVFLD